MKSTNKYTATDTSKAANHSSWNAIKEEPDKIGLQMKISLPHQRKKESEIYTWYRP